MKRALLVAFLVFLITGVSAAPTTRRVRSDWADSVTSLGRAIVANKADALPGLLATEVAIQRFDGRAAGPAKLFTLPATRVLLFCRAYNDVPDTLAGDLSEAARGWKLPDAVKSQYIIAVPVATRRQPDGSTSDSAPRAVIQPG